MRTQILSKSSPAHSPPPPLPAPALPPSPPCSSLGERLRDYRKALWSRFPVIIQHIRAMDEEKFFVIVCSVFGGGSSCIGA